MKTDRALLRAATPTSFFHEELQLGGPFTPSYRPGASLWFVATLFRAKFMADGEQNGDSRFLGTLNSY